MRVTFGLAKKSYQGRTYQSRLEGLSKIRPHLNNHITPQCAVTEHRAEVSLGPYFSLLPLTQQAYVERVWLTTRAVATFMLLNPTIMCVVLFSFQVPDRGTMIRELEQRKLHNTRASVVFGSAKVGTRLLLQLYQYPEAVQ